MAGKEERSAKVATLAEALEILGKREKGGEFGYEQQLTLEYAKKFSKLDADKSLKLKKELEELGISEKIAVSLVNVMPIDLMQLKQILANDKKELDASVAEKAMAEVEKARKG